METLLGLMKAHQHLVINTFITFNFKHLQVDVLYVAVIRQIPYLDMYNLFLPWVCKLRMTLAIFMKVHHQLVVNIFITLI